MKTRSFILLVFLLIIIDQTIKVIINKHFLECQFEIIPSLFEFKPTFNVMHSYVNVLLNSNFNINVGLGLHVILYLFIGIIVLAYYNYLRNNIFNNTKLLDIAISFLFAGIICALIGNLIWGNGTLDYIYLKQFFVFDLKDIYIDFGVILCIIYVIKNKTQLKPIKVKDVFLYVKTRLKIYKK